MAKFVMIIVNQLKMPIERSDNSQSIENNSQTQKENGQIRDDNSQSAKNAYRKKR
jgi:hypothetical protein